MYQNLWDTAKVVLWRFIALTVHIWKELKNSQSNLSSLLKNPEEKKQNNLKEADGINKG